jgi:hypothetical protein
MNEPGLMATEHGLTFFAIDATADAGEPPPDQRRFGM